MRPQRASWATATHGAKFQLMPVPAISFAVTRAALEGIGGFDTTIDFHGEDTNLGRRLSRTGAVELRYDCYLFTSARRYNAMGKGAVFRLYVRNFVSELLHHRPKDSAHLDVRH